MLLHVATTHVHALCFVHKSKTQAYALVLTLILLLDLLRLAFRQKQLLFGTHSRLFSCSERIHASARALLRSGAIKQRVLIFKNILLLQWFALESS